LGAAISTHHVPPALALQSPLSSHHSRAAELTSQNVDIRQQLISKYADIIVHFKETAVTVQPDPGKEAPVLDNSKNLIRVGNSLF
jgi:hypothetical protein